MVVWCCGSVVGMVVWYFCNVALRTNAISILSVLNNQKNNFNIFFPLENAQLHSE